ncbi:MAG: SPOR domain-containing protein [Treponema sp.]|jgi:hypothetical protein|nr:SPOR domain-containing protein [Treponema sp.]
MKRIGLVWILLLVGFALFAASKPSIEGRAMVASTDVFPAGLFAKAIGFLPGDSVSVKNPATGSSINVMILGTLDLQDGVAILLSPEAASRLFIAKNSNTLVSVSKRISEYDGGIFSARKSPSDPDNNPEDALPLELEEKMQKQQNHLSGIDPVGASAPIVLPDTYAQSPIENSVYAPDVRPTDGFNTGYGPDIRIGGGVNSADIPTPPILISSMMNEPQAAPPPPAELPKIVTVPDSAPTVVLAPVQEPAAVSVPAVTRVNDSDVANVRVSDTGSLVDPVPVTTEHPFAGPVEPFRISEEPTDPVSPDTDPLMMAKNPDYNIAQTGADVRLADFIDGESPAPERTNNDIQDFRINPNSGMAKAGTQTDANVRLTGLPETEPESGSFVPVLEPVIDIKTSEDDRLAKSDFVTAQKIDPDTAEKTAAGSTETRITSVNAENVSEEAIVLDHQPLKPLKIEGVRLMPAPPLEPPKIAAGQAVEDDVPVIREDHAVSPLEAIVKNAEQKPEEHVVEASAIPGEHVVEALAIPEKNLPPSVPVAVPGTENKLANIIVESAKLRAGSYYIQIATLSDEKKISTLLANYSEKYPFALVPAPTSSAYQILVGPLNVDEYGVVLARFKNNGYKDAFLKKIN